MACSTLRAASQEVRGLSGSGALLKDSETLPKAPAALSACMLPFAAGSAIRVTRVLLKPTPNRPPLRGRAVAGPVVEELV